MPNQLPPRLPARNTALPTSVFKHAMFLSDKLVGCTSPVNPRFSDRDAVRGVDGIPPSPPVDALSRALTTRAGTASFSKLVKKASRGVLRASIPATFVIA
jgi:hypothetical protein